MLTGKNVILTGCNRGIGNAVLRLFASEHANVWCLNRTVNETFEAQARELEAAFGVRIKPIRTDLGDRDSTEAAMAQIAAEKLPVDILVNNRRGTFLMTPPEEADALFQVNFFAPIRLMQLAAKRMIRQKSGVIVNIGSASGLEHNTGNSFYGASKAALMWMTQTASRELAAYNIRVNAVAPGLTDTEMNRGNEETIRTDVLPRMNIRRCGTPEEIAKTVLFLASDASSFISGQILRADGGRF